MTGSKSSRRVQRPQWHQMQSRTKADSNNKQFLTLDTVRGMLKSFPPCSLKPQGAGPLRVTEYMFIALGEERGENNVLISQKSRKRFSRPHVLFCFIRAAWLSAFVSNTNTHVPMQRLTLKLFSFSMFNV